MDKPKAILMDLDGTVYTGNILIPGALETIEYIRSKGVKLFFFTNNSEKTRKEVADKLNNLNVPCEESDIVSSGFIAVNLVKEKGFENVFVSGSDSFRREFTDYEVTLTDEFHCKTLIIGMDSKFDFQKLTAAVNAALNADRIIACNKDRIFPVEGGIVRPGCGAMVSSIEYCSRKEVDMIIGKPARYMMDYVCKLEKTTPERIIVIGDTFDSDTVMAIDTGAHNILIGENERAEFCVTGINQIINVLQNRFDL